MAVQMELSRILIRETDDMHIVELREVDGERVFPIVIGLTEAAAIERRLMGQAPPRPLTHELLADVIGGSVRSWKNRHLRPEKKHFFCPAAHPPPGGTHRYRFTPQRCDRVGGGPGRADLCGRPRAG